MDHHECSLYLVVKSVTTNLSPGPVGRVQSQTTKDTMKRTVATWKGNKPRSYTTKTYMACEYSKTNRSSVVRVCCKFLVFHFDKMLLFLQAHLYPNVRSIIYNTDITLGTLNKNCHKCLVATHRLASTSWLVRKIKYLIWISQSFFLKCQGHVTQRSMRRLLSFIHISKWHGYVSWKGRLTRLM